MYFRHTGFLNKLICEVSQEVFVSGVPNLASNIQSSATTLKWEKAPSKMLGYVYGSLLYKLDLNGTQRIM